MEPSLLMNLFGGQGNNPTIAPSSTATASGNKSSTGMQIVSGTAGKTGWGVVKIVLVSAAALYAVKLWKGR